MKNITLKYGLLIVKTATQFNANNLSSGQFVFIKSQQKIDMMKVQMLDVLNRLEYNDNQIDQYWVEIHKNIHFRLHVLFLF